MRLVVDGLFLRPGRVGGIEYMLYSLLTALVAGRSEEDRIQVLLPPEVDLSARPFAAQVEQVTVDRVGNRFLSIERSLPADYDAALFPNYYTPLATLRRRGRASITVVHDLQFRAFPTNFTPAKRTFQDLALRATRRLADEVVVISDFTAAELKRDYPPVGGLHHVPNPIDWERFDDEAEPPTSGGRLGSVDQPFFLLAAAQYRHKNVPTAIEAFRRVREHAPHARLVLVGQVPQHMRETRVSDALPEHAGVLQLGFVPDEQLAWLYRRAAAVLLPSLYEGCGLPCAEALGLGTTVVHSGCGALPEVTDGEGIVISDPLDPELWATAMLDVLDGRLAPPGEARSAAVRTVHDPAVAGGRYWDIVRGAVQRVRRR